MKEVEPSPFMALSDEVLSYKGLSAYLKLSQNTLRHKVMKGKIPFFKIDGAVRFSKKHIDAWLQEHHTGAKRKQAQNNGELFSDGGGEET